jgi:hypothetical protein
LVHAVVTQILEVQEPEFIIETQTAVMGVRGSEGYIMQIANSSILYNIRGIWQGQSKNPRFPAVFLVQMGEYFEAPMDKHPFKGKITPDMLEMLKKMMATGVRDGALLGGIPLVTGGEGRPEWTPRREQMTQPVIPPQLIPPVHAPPSSGSGGTGFVPSGPL